MEIGFFIALCILTSMVRFGSLYWRASGFLKTELYLLHLFKMDIMLWICFVYLKWRYYLMSSFIHSIMFI